MKKILLIFFILHFSFYTFHFAIAQNTNPIPCPTDKIYKWGVGVQMNTIDKFFPYGYSGEGFGELCFEGIDTKNKSFSIGIMGNYLLSSDILFRFKYILTNIQMNVYSDLRNSYTSTSPINVEYLITDDTLGQKRHSFIQGIAWNIKKDKLNFYAGFEIPFIKYGDFTHSFTTTYYDTTSTIGYIVNDKVNIPGGFSIGTGAFIGFSVVPLKCFSIGAEFSSAFFYSKFKGIIECTTTQTYPINQIHNSYWKFSKKGYDFCKGVLSFNLVYLF